MAESLPAPEVSRPRPRGRVAVRHAVLEAAADLMAEHGSAASLRDIAAAAGVNLGLIHRHFGNKEDLRRAVLEHVAAKHRERLEARGGEPSIAELFDSVQQDDRHWKILVRAMLGGEEISEVTTRFPVASRLLEIAVERAGPDADLDDLRFKVGRLIATALGWLMLEPFIVEALGIEQPLDELRDRLIRERAKDLDFPD